MKSVKPASATLGAKIRKNWGLYILLIPAVVILAMFTYRPMFGIIMAFQNFVPSKGIFGSDFVGFDNFVKFFNSYKFWPTIKNTLTISIYSIVVTFPLPICVAIMVNQMSSASYRKIFQVTTYLPHFISTVVMCGMIILFFSPSTGCISKLVGLFGFTLPNLLGEASAFASVYVWTEVWQHCGWDSILYIAALSAISPDLYEAATVDGASKWQKILKIDIPLLLPTATIMFILRTGSVMNIGFEKVYLLQNSLNIGASEVLSTYIYDIGIINSQYSLSAAIGLFNNLINFILLLVVNFMAKKMSDTSLL